LILILIRLAYCKLYGSRSANRHIYQEQIRRNICEAHDIRKQCLVKHLTVTFSLGSPMEI